MGISLINSVLATIPLSAMISVWFGGSVAVGTFDRVSDKKVETAIIESESSKEI